MGQDRVDFDTYKEKVVDTSLEFAPTADECARIALEDGTNTGKLLTQNCITPGIRNIRLIKKIERCAQKIQPMLVRFDELVFKQVVHSLALFSWSYSGPRIQTRQ